MRACIYIPEFSMRDVRLGAPVELPCRVTIPALVRNSGVAGARLLPDPRDRADGEGSTGRRFGLPDYVGKVELQNHGDFERGNEGTPKSRSAVAVLRPSLPGALPETLWAAIYGEAPGHCGIPAVYRDK